MKPVSPGNPLDESTTELLWHWCWLRPVSSDIRVGVQSAFTWKFVYLTPSAARRLSVGVLIGPPKVSGSAYDNWSISTMTTFGAPSGGRGSNRGGGVTLRQSGSVIGSYRGRGSGSVSPNTPAGSALRTNSINPSSDIYVSPRPPEPLPRT